MSVRTPTYSHLSLLEYIGIALLLFTIVIFGVLLPKVTIGVRLFLCAWGANILAAATQGLSTSDPIIAFTAQGISTLFPTILCAGSYYFVDRKPPAWIYFAMIVLFLVRGSFAANGDYDLGRNITLPFEVAFYATSAWIVTRGRIPTQLSSALLSLGFAMLIGVEIWDTLTNNAARSETFNALPWVIVLVSCGGFHAYAWADKSKRDIHAKQRSIEDRFDALTRYAQDVISEVTNDGEILFVSANAKPVLGYPAQDIMDMGLVAYMNISRAKHLGQHIVIPTTSNLDTLIDDGPFSYRIQIRHPDDSDHVLECGGSRYANEQGQICIVCVTRDITARFEAEQHDFSRQKLESLGTMSAGIAHDFRNLLTTIYGSTELLKLDLQLKKHEQVDQHIRQILKASEQATGLTSQLLAYAGKAPLALEDLDLQVVLHNLSPLLHSAIADRAHLVLDISPDLPTIAANPVAIQQVVINLVTNAVEAMEYSSGTISVRALATTDIAGQEVVKIIVRDDGAGMDQETQAHIFEPFYTTKFTGRGLGLAALQGLVTSHNGQISVTSSPGEGSTFTIALPVAQPQPGEKESVIAQDIS